MSALVQACGTGQPGHHQLMAGQELVTEGFVPGQVGSSAMPHKMNTRSAERVNGLSVVVRGYLSMTSRAGGRPVERGRRVVLGGPPGGAPERSSPATACSRPSCRCSKASVPTAVIEPQLDRYLPFLATTKVLVAAVRGGVGREQAHGHQGARGRRRPRPAEGGDQRPGRAPGGRRPPRPGPGSDRCGAGRPLRVRGRRRARSRPSSARSRPRSPTTPTPATVQNNPLSRRTPGKPLGESLPVTDLGLPHVHSGKVRDIYAVGDDRLLMVTSDRIWPST